MFGLFVLLMIIAITIRANDLDACVRQSGPARTTLRRNACNYLNLLMLARHNEVGVSHPEVGLLEFHPTNTTSSPEI